MDPEVSPIFITTLADQSIRATAGFVSLFAREFRRAGTAPRRPLLVVNRVPVLFRQTGMDKQLTETLTTELLKSLVFDTAKEVVSSEDVFAIVPEIQPFIQVDLPELPDIQVPTASWRDYVDQLTSSGFSRALTVL